MADDFDGDGDDDGLEDTDGDGTLDESDGDNDNDGIPDNEERTDWFGNHVVEVDGQQLIEKEDIFGNTVLENDDREVVATIEPDGDIRMEGGPTYTNLDDNTGWRDYRGTDGSTLTISENTAGLGEMHTSGQKDPESDSDEPESDDQKDQSAGGGHIGDKPESDGFSSGNSNSKSQVHTVPNDSVLSAIETELVRPMFDLLTRFWRWLG